MLTLAYFYWDPPREMFFIPLLERPIMWYGLFFVMGLMFGYFLAIPVFKEKLAKTRKLLQRDVANWSVFCRLLRKAAEEDRGKPSEIVRQFSQEVQDQLKNQSIPKPLKEQILQECNKLNLPRQQWESIFPKSFFSLKELSRLLADRLLWFLLVGIIIGARLGHVLFYEWPKFSAHPLDIFKIWEGGLASHGGTIGILVALACFLRTARSSFPEIHFISLLDSIAVPTGLSVCCIRLGNFINQEIIGTPSILPWAIIFGHPADGSPAVPRHPTQLYEAFAYLGTFYIIYTLWVKKRETLTGGTLSGLLLILVFGCRFFLEFTKMPLSHMIDESLLQTGQLLSIPFILLGIGLLFNPLKRPTSVDLPKTAR